MCVGSTPTRDRFGLPCCNDRCDAAATDPDSISVLGVANGKRETKIRKKIRAHESAQLLGGPRRFQLIRTRPDGKKEAFAAVCHGHWFPHTSVSSTRTQSAESVKAVMLACMCFVGRNTGRSRQAVPRLYEGPWLQDGRSVQP